MAISDINLGSSPNDGNGSTLRAGGAIVNQILDMWNTVTGGIAYASGDVGIGTSTPNHELSIFHFTDPTIQLINSTTGQGAGDGFTIGLDNSNNGTIIVREDANLNIFTNNLQRATILSNGSVGIATPNPSEKLEVIGTVKATAFDPPSDERLKKNIEPLEKDVYNLLPKSFEFKENDKGVRYGFIAQEMLVDYPELVKEGEFYSIKSESIIALAVKTIKDQKEEIDSLKSELAAIKAHLGI